MRATAAPLRLAKRKQIRSLPSKAWPGSDKLFNTGFCPGIYNNNASYRLPKAQGWVATGRDESARDRHGHRYRHNALDRYGLAGGVPAR